MCRDDGEKRPLIRDRPELREFEEDPGAAARGILIGLFLAIFFWLLCLGIFLASC